MGSRYELETLIACGGMGQVWRGRDTLLGRPVAIKVLRSEYSEDPTFLARFRAEATHAAALSHPNIAAVYDYGEVPADDGGEHLAYLVMELVEGEPLSTLLREEGPLSPEDTLAVLRQTAEALAEAHHVGLVHRDVKPSNILVRPDEQVKITDFGIAWSAGSVPLTQAGQVLGTPQYLSPELAVGGSPSPASDVYSLGLVGYECLTGEPAFAGDNAVAVALKQVNEEPAPLPEDLPPGVRELVDVAVAKDPDERLPNGDAFVAAIDRVQAGRPLDDVVPSTQGLPLVARPPAAATGARPSGPAPASGPRRRAVLLAAVLAVLAAGFVALVGLVDLPGGGADPPTDAAQADEVGQDAAIVLDGADYVGRPVDEVARELAALGLSVQQQAAAAGNAAPDAVTQLSPLGAALQPGDVVTVVYAAGEAAAPEQEPGTGATQVGSTEQGQTGVPLDAAVGSAPGGPGTTAGGDAAAVTPAPSVEPAPAPRTGATGTGATGTGTTDPAATDGAGSGAIETPDPGATDTTAPEATDGAPVETVTPTSPSEPADTSAPTSPTTGAAPSSDPAGTSTAAETDAAAAPTGG
nr:serine/threonine-protein kinase [Modestobacter versicolor]